MNIIQIAEECGFFIDGDDVGYYDINSEFVSIKDELQAFADRLLAEWREKDDFLLPFDTKAGHMVFHEGTKASSLMASLKRRREHIDAIRKGDV